jgi:hypothetical protein
VSHSAQASYLFRRLALRQALATSVKRFTGRIMRSRFMSHAKATMTLAIYTHLFNTDDRADAMAAPGAMSRPTVAPNVNGHSVRPSLV